MTDNFVDYGVVVVAPHPLAKKKWVAIVMGGTGLGTRIAAETLVGLRRFPSGEAGRGAFVQTFYIPVEEGALVYRGTCSSEG
jgi:hypothetical protein